MKFWIVLASALAAGTLAAQERASLVSKQVRVAGEVRHELTLSVEQLRALAQRRGHVETGGYGGIRLTELLQEAEIRQDSRNALRRTYVVARATDGYVAVFSWGELFNSSVGPRVVVAYERDAQPLRDGEGAIALLSFADARLGARHVKWLNRIEVTRVPE